MNCFSRLARSLLLPAALAFSLAGCRGGAVPRATAAAARSTDPGPRYRDVAGETGLRFHWGHGGKSPLTNLESFGCGCAFLDANEDGWLDVLLVGEPVCGLFLNQKTGAFVDATAESGLLEARGPWKGCAVGDYDSDGHLDLLLTGYNAVRLLRGAGSGVFRDASAAARLQPAGWGSSAGFMDLDGDADLDLVIGHYVITNEHTPKYCQIKLGVMSGCPPHTYSPQFARLYRNNGNGTFSDVSKTAGMEKTHGKALVLAYVDFDEDGRQDFYVGNDGTPAELMHNLGGLRFENVGLSRGVALGVYGQAQAAMGSDWADFNRDGRLDLVVTAFSDEPYSLYENRGQFFENVSTRKGIARPTTKPLGFGAKFLDADNDGWPDIVFANGHVYDGVQRIDPGSTYLQPLMFFRNNRGQNFEEIGAQVGPEFTRPILGRGLATGDYDNDGRIDMLVVDYEGAPLLLHNETAQPGHWLELELTAHGGNRHAYGAVVTLHASTTRWTQTLSPASSYLSSSSPVLHFGLGPVTRLDRIEVRWPDGRKESFATDRVDLRSRIVQGTGRIR